MQNEQIIAVINTLTEKFGVTVDWHNYIKYEFITSYIWLGIGIALLIAAIILIFRSIKLSKICDKYGELYIAAYNEDATSDKTEFYKEKVECKSVNDVLCTTLGIVLGIIGVSMIMSQVLDIIKCCTSPEMQMFSYIKSLMTK